MASGMEFMLKSMGLDPEAITNTVSTVAKTALAMKEQLDRIEIALAALDVKLTKVSSGNSATENQETEK